MKKLKTSKNEKIISLIKKNYSKPKFPLNHKTDIQLVIAVIMSANSQDAQVNKITKNIFKKYKSAKDVAKTKLNVFENEIKSIGLYKTKAKNIIKTCKIIEEKHCGKVPDTMEELLLLPGIGRKSANVILSRLYKIPAIIIDTHMIRICKRLLFSKKNNADSIEKDMMLILQKKDWIVVSHKLREHARLICRPKPMCSDCFLNKLCQSAFKVL